MDESREPRARSHGHALARGASVACLVTVVAVLVSRCSPADGGSERATSASLTLESSAFTHGAAIPASAAFDGPGCGGGNRSPALAFDGAPTGTASFALLLHDSDAPGAHGFDHWVVFDLPRTTTSIATAADPRSLGAHVGRNDFGRLGYGGPCPPAGPAHHYVFTVYALDVPSLALEEGASADAVRERMRGHVLAEASLEGRYARDGR